MTWEWVILILGVLTIISALFGFMAWSTAKTERFKTNVVQERREA